jgi:DNA polymerase-3 subunit epsilon
MRGVREHALDVETTGMERGADRVIEIGVVEMLDMIPTGRTFHRYLCPAPRRVHPGAFRVHGLSDAFLRDKPPFEDVAEELIAFIGDARLVIHNAPFDVGMLNHEFSLLFDPPAPIRLDDVVDTLKVARRKLPGLKSKGLDALAAHFKVNAAGRARHHGALVDAEILAGIYRGLNPPEQQGFALEVPVSAPVAEPAPRPVFRPRLTDAERERHEAFVRSLGPGAIWNEYIGADDAR